MKGFEIGQEVETTVVQIGGDTVFIRFPMTRFLLIWGLRAKDLLTKQNLSMQTENAQ